MFATIVPMAMISALIYGWVIVSHLNTLRLFHHGSASNDAYTRFRHQFRMIVTAGLIMTIFSLVETISVYRISVYVPYWPVWWLWTGCWQLFFIIPFLLICLIWFPSPNILDLVYKPPVDESSEDSDQHTSDGSSSSDPEHHHSDDSDASSVGDVDGTCDTDSENTMLVARQNISSSEDEYDSDESLKMFANL